MWFNVACKLGKKPVRSASNSPLGQLGAGGQRAVVRPRIVVGERTMGLNMPNTHCNFLTLPANSSCVLREGYHGWLEVCIQAMAAVVGFPIPCPVSGRSGTSSPFGCGRGRRF